MEGTWNPPISECMLAYLEERDGEAIGPQVTECEVNVMVVV